MQMWLQMVVFQQDFEFGFKNQMQVLKGRIGCWEVAAI